VQSVFLFCDSSKVELNVVTWLDGPINCVAGLAAMKAVKLKVQDLHESLDHRRVRYNGSLVQKADLSKLELVDVLVFHSRSSKLIRKAPDAEPVPVWLEGIVQLASSCKPRHLISKSDSRLSSFLIVTFSFRKPSCVGLPW
jgi:hypothetical protein